MTAVNGDTYSCDVPQIPLFQDEGEVLETSNYLRIPEINNTHTVHEVFFSDLCTCITYAHTT